MGQIKNIKLHIVTDIKMTDKQYPFLLHCSESKIPEDLFNQLSVSLRIQLLEKLLESPKEEYSEDVLDSDISQQPSDTDFMELPKEEYSEDVLDSSYTNFMELPKEELDGNCSGVDFLSSEENFTEDLF